MTPDTKKLPHIGYLPIVFIGILLGTLALQIWFRVPVEKTTSLLADAPDRQLYSTEAELTAKSPIPLSFPEKLFGSTFYLGAVYPTPFGGRRTRSVSVVYTKDQARFAELIVHADAKLADISPPYTGYPQETFSVDTETNGLFIRLRKGFTCTSPVKTGAYAMCLFTNTILFEKDGSVIQLSSDGDRISEGELIEMARSVP